MKIEKINDLLNAIHSGPSKWELDNVVYHDRTTNAATLYKFLTRIKTLQETKEKTQPEIQELANLSELYTDLDDDDVVDLIDPTDDESKEQFIEDLARRSAIEVLTNGKMDFDTMTTACKLSPNDFILCAKRTQDLINSIRGLVIKGETLSQDVAQK
jgi:Mg/Co/Ni transporter MgtE